MKSTSYSLALEPFTLPGTATLLDALVKIDANKQGFVVIISNENMLLGVLTDGDARRAIIRGYAPDSPVSGVYNPHATTVRLSDAFDSVIDLFKIQSIKFLPVVDDRGELVNLVTKSQMHALLLQDIHADLSFNFASLDTAIVDHEIYRRPWGYYKTTVLNDYFQAKVISVAPGGQLSLQSHNRREEHWIVVHGNGTVQIDESLIAVRCGSTLFIPKGAKHRLANTDPCQSLIITEVQIGDYFGEDDIIRYEDMYGRSAAPSKGSGPC